MVARSASIALTLLTLALPTAAADRVVFKSGGVVEGATKSEKQKNGQEIVTVRLPGGGTLRVLKSSVKGIKKLSKIDREYQRRVAEFTPTVAGHHQLADWCHRNGLHKQRRFHLRQILQIDPEDVDARHGLGYSHVRGRWVTQAEFQRGEGFIKHEGRWKLPQEAKIVDARRNRDASVRTWKLKVKKLCETLLSNSPKNAATRHQALASIKAIKDPLAVAGIQEQLKRVQVRPLRLLLLDCLAQIGTDSAFNAILGWTLNDLDVEVFHHGVALLVKHHPPKLAREVVGFLKDSHNARVNRAAYLLGKLNDETTVIPLIDALITTHYLLPQTIGKKDEKTFSFLNPNSPTNGVEAPGSTFTAGRRKRNNPLVPKMNNEVLSALVNITGVSYGFDQTAWKNWHTAQQNRPSLSRRK